MDPVTVGAGSGRLGELFVDHTERVEVDDWQAVGGALAQLHAWLIMACDSARHVRAGSAKRDGWR
jgi:hypothetical protein